jgi:hypothetical protein
MIGFLKYIFSKKSEEYNWFEVILCRIRNHPSGVWWYNLHGLEPDMRCKGCGDDLG